MFESLRKRMDERKIKNNNPFSRKNDLKRQTFIFNEEGQEGNNEQQNCFFEEQQIQSYKSLKPESVTFLTVEQNIKTQEETIKQINKFRKLVSNSVSKLAFQKFISASHRGAHYSLKYLKGPSQKYLESKKIKLSEPKNSKQKFLFLDLDQTLIHSVLPNQSYDVELKFEGQDSIYFNIRPGCLEFLDRMSQFYTIYIFTASTIDYAEPIIDYLNKHKKVIHGILSRTHCMQTKNGCFIKDLRIISNRTLKDIILVDNLVHSFGLQIDNGIPILDFTNDQSDKQLEHIEKLLMRLKDQQDVRPFLSKELELRNLIVVKYKDILN